MERVLIAGDGGLRDGGERDDGERDDGDLMARGARVKTVPGIKT